MWKLVVFFFLLESVKTDDSSPGPWMNPHVPPHIPSIVTAFKLVHEYPNCRVNLYTVDVGEVSPTPIPKREKEPITNFVPQYYWDFPCLEKYDYYTFNMMKFPNNKLYLTGCFFFNEPNQRLRCYTLMESGVFEQTRDVACNDKRIWAGGSRFYIQIGDETDPDAIAVGAEGHKCLIQKTDNGKYSAEYKSETELRVITYDALYNRNVFSNGNYWKMFVFGWSFNRKPNDYNYPIFSKETKGDLWAFVYMRERFDFIFDINLVSNYTTTVVIPVATKGSTCWSGSEGQCMNITQEHGSNVNEKSHFCPVPTSANHWDNSMCYKMRKGNCVVYDCQPRDLSGITPEDWTYCRGNTMNPCQKREYIAVPKDPAEYPSNGSRTHIIELILAILIILQ